MISRQYLVGLLGLLLLLPILNAYTVIGGAAYCHSCGDCVDALNNKSITTVYLNKTTSAIGTCINNPENISNKVFDCQNYEVTGTQTGSYGINIQGKENVTIRNCMMYNFTDGYYIDDGARNITLRDSKAYNNTNSGVRFDIVYDSLIYNVSSYNNSYGFYIYRSSGISISECNAYDNSGGSTGYGFYISHSSSENNTISNSKSYRNGNDGFHLSGIRWNNTFRNNTAYENGGCGFRFLGSNNSDLILNIARDQKGGGDLNSGFCLDNSHNNGLLNNTAYNNPEHGYYVSSSTDNVFVDNIAYHNAQSGIYITSSSNNNGFLRDRYYSNSVAGTGYEIYLTSTSYANIFTNVMVHDTSYYLKQEPMNLPPNNFTNFTASYNRTIGLVTWNFMDLTNLTLNLTDLHLEPDFVSMNDTAAFQANRSANITINVSSCAPTPTVFRKTGFPTTRADILTGDVYPTSITCANKIARFNVSSFSGYTADPLVNQCFYADVPNSVYTLTTNLVGNKTDAVCITINASNVTINCSGYNITGNYSGTTYGIKADNVNNVVIQDCVVSNYTYGVYLNVTTYSNVTNVTAYNNSQYGFSLYSSSNNNLINNTAYNNTQRGIFLESSSNNNISDNTAYNNNYGIQLFSNSNSNILTNNRAYDNSQFGIVLESSSNNNLTNNTAYNHLYCGIYLLSSSNNIVTDSNSHNNEWGIHLYASDFNNVTNNIIHDNTGAALSSGIYIYPDSDENFVFNNTVYSNAQGIYVWLSSRCNISNNNVSNSSDSGIVIRQSSGNSLTDNIVYGNVNYGFDLYSSSNNILTNNRAYNNSQFGFYILQSDYNTLTSNNASDNAGEGFYLYSSNYSNLTSNNAYNNLRGFYLELSNYNNLSSNIAHNNSAEGFWLYSSNFSILTNNNAYNNSWYGFYISSNSNNNILTNNSAYSNYEGFSIFNSYNITMSASLSYNNSLGVLIGDSNVSGTDFHLYNNSYDLSVGTGGSGFAINLTNVTIDNPTGNYTNYTSLVINDVQPAGSTASFNVKWNPEPAAPRPGYVSFNQKYVNITAASVTVDQIRFTWLDSDLGGYNENKFELWFYNGTDWNYTSGQVLDAANNYIEVQNFVPGSIYGILQNNISACQIISSPGSYALNTNAEGAPYDASEVFDISRACIKIATSNVTLDCAGYNITNNGTANAVGIVINGSIYTNVTIMNCPGISNYKIGVDIYEADGNRIQNVTSYNNTLSGFRLMSVASSNVLANNTAYNNSYYGFYLYQGFYNNLTGNIAYNNSQYGFYIISSSEWNRFTDNLAYNNFMSGFYLSSSSNNVLSNNSAYNNSEDGFYLSSSSYNTLANNSAYNNSYFGFYLDSSSDNNLTNNSAYNNSYFGFLLYSSSDNNLTNNFAYNNLGYGFFLSFSSYNILTNNFAYNNSYRGFGLYSSSNNVLSNNSAYNNSEHGFYLNLNSNYNTLTNNFAYENTQNGFYLVSSSYNNLTYNNASRNDVGFYIENSPYNNFTRNIADSNGGEGFSIYYSNNNNLIENDAYGNSWGFYTYHSNETLFFNNNGNNNAFGFMMDSSSYTNATSNNASSNSDSGFLTTNYCYYNNFVNNIASKNSNHGFRLEYTHYSNFTNNTANYNTYGFKVVSSDANIFINNTAHNNTQEGFGFDGSSYNTLINNSAFNNVGVAAGDGFVFNGASDNNVVINNYAYNNLRRCFYIQLSNGNNLTNNIAYGCRVAVRMSTSSSNVMTNNTLHDAEFGIYMDTYSSMNDILSNRIYNNSASGVVVALFSDSNEIMGNEIYNNSQKGLYLDSSADNIVQSNLIYDNGESGISLSTTTGGTILNNTVHDNAAGISLYELTTLPGTLANNTAYNNTRGLSITRTNDISFFSNPAYGGNEIYENNVGLYIQDSNNTIVTRELNLHDNSQFEIYGSGTINTLRIEKTNTPEEEYVAFADGTNVTNLYLLYNVSDLNGRVNFPSVNITTASADIPLDNSNFLLAADFISLDDSAQPDFNVTANVTLYTPLCTNLKVYKDLGFPQSRAEILTDGSEYTPLYSTCAGNRADFGVSSFSGYALNGSAAPSPVTGGGEERRCTKVSISRIGIECPENAVTFIVKEDGTPVSGARVVIEGPWPWSDVKTTNGNGEVVFTLPKGGHYVLRVSGGIEDYCSISDYEFDYTMCGCFNDDDCKDTEYCYGAGGVTHLEMGTCKPVECECGYVKDHTCYPYDCCKDEDCAEGYRCENHVCVKEKPECESDADCADNERCSNGKCELITGECGYAANHTWYKYECCEDADCPQGEFCFQHACMLFKIETNDTGYVGEQHDVHVYPEGQYTLVLTDPDGRTLTLSTDENGYARFLLETEGRYSVALAKEGVPPLSVEVQSLKRLPTPPEEKPVTLLDQVARYFWWLLILLLLIIGYILFRRRKTKKYKVGE